MARKNRVPQYGDYAILEWNANQIATFIRDYSDHVADATGEDALEWCSYDSQNNAMVIRTESSAIRLFKIEMHGRPHWLAEYRSFVGHDATGRAQHAWKYRAHGDTEFTPETLENLFHNLPE